LVYTDNHETDGLLYKNRKIVFNQLLDQLVSAIL
jgi:hypothetical protein